MEAFGDYLLLGELGRGGTAVVWEARHLRLQAPRAIKILSAEADPRRSDRTVERFLTEARVLARLEHPSIVKVHGAGQHDGRRFIEMELVEGGSLAQRLADGPPSPQQAARWALSIAQALACAHNAGVLHRDVKPGNVLLTHDDRAKLGDFGLARDLDDAVAGTRTIGVVGTPAFMAPEVARDGMDAFTARSDIHGLGAVLYQMLTGRPPHLGSDPLKVLEDVRTRRPPRPQSIRPDVPLDLEVLCLRCMDPDPAQRFASAHEVAEELQRHLDGVPIRSRPAGPVRHLAAWTRRHRALAASLFALMAALVGGLGVVSWQWLRAEQLARTLSSSLAVERLTTAQAQWDAGNNLRALADVARAMHDHDPRHDARRLLEHWLHQGAFVPPPGLVWNHPAPVVRAVYSPGARRILVQLEDKELLVRVAGSTNIQLHLHGVDMGHPAIPGFDDATLLARQNDGTLRLWSLPKGTNAPSVAWEVPRVRLAVASAPYAHWAALDEAGDLWTGTADARATPRREASMRPPSPWRTLAISADGRWIAGARPGRGWDLLDTRAARSPRPPEAAPEASTPSRGETPGPVSALAFSPKDDSLLVVGTGFVQVLPPDNRRQPLRITEPIPWVGGRFDGAGRRVFLSDDRGVFYAIDSAAKRVRLWEQGAADTRMSLPWSSTHVPDLQRVAFVDPSLATGSDYSLRMHPASGQPQGSVVEHASAVTAIAIDPNHTQVLVGCEDGTVRAWAWNRATWVPDFPITNAPGADLRPVPRGGALLVVRPDGPGLWEPSKVAHVIRRLPHLSLHEPLPIPGEGFGPNAVLGLDATRRKVQLHALNASSSPTPAATAPAVLADLPEPAHSLAASPNGRRIAWAGDAHVGWVRRSQGQAPLSRSLALPKARQLVVAGRADRFWALQDDGAVHQVDAEDTLVPRLLIGAGPVVQMQASGDGRSVVLLGSNGVARFHDGLSPGAMPRTLALLQPIRTLACSPGDARVAVATRIDVHVWDPWADAASAVLIRGVTHPIHHLTFHPSADILAVSTEADTVRLYSARTGLPLGPTWLLRDGKPAEGGFRVAFTHDDRWLVGWSESGVLMRVSLPHRTEVWTDQADPLLDLAVYLSGRHLLADGPRRHPDEPLSDAARAALVARLRDARDKGLWDHRWDLYVPR